MLADRKVKVCPHPCSNLHLDHRGRAQLEGVIRERAEVLPECLGDLRGLGSLSPPGALALPGGNTHTQPRDEQGEDDREDDSRREG